MINPNRTIEICPIQSVQRHLLPHEPKNDDVHDESIMHYIIIQTGDSHIEILYENL